MKALLALSLPLALLAASLAGCSSTPAGPTTPPMEGGMYVIHIVAGNHYSPANAAVPLNATVKWVDDDGVHDVTDSDHTPAAWESPRGMQPGSTYTHQFTAAGTYHYYCTIHGQSLMSATLTVG